MTIKLNMPKTQPDLKPRITVIGVGGAGGNAVNNMIKSKLEGVEFVAANSDAQALSHSVAERKIQLGRNITQGLGAGSRPDIGRAAAEESLDEIVEHVQGANMVFITAGMGGGTGTGAAPVVARAAREQGVLTVGVVTKPFQFEGINRMRLAESGIEELQQYVDTLIIIPNQNLFRVANDKTTFAEAFKMADDVLHSGVRGVTDLMVMPGLINLDFADVRQVMSEMGKAMMGTGEAEGEKRAMEAAEAAISNPLLEDSSMAGARGILINITGGSDLTLFEVDEAANRIRDEVDPEAHIIFGSTFEDDLEGRIRISVIATGIDVEADARPHPTLLSLVSTSAEAGARTQDSDDGGIAAQGGEGAVAEPTLFVPHAPPAAPFGPASGPMAHAVGQTAHAIAAPAVMPEPGIVEAEPFLPPPPTQAVATPQPLARPEPFAEAAMANGGAAVAKDRSSRPTLFERMTGTGRARAAKAPTVAQPAAPAAMPEPVPEVPRVMEAVEAPDVMDVPETPNRQESQAPTGSEPAEQPETGTDAAAATPSEAAEQRRLSEIDNGAEGKAGIEEDLLDIPAFLRRQAN
ncbi:MAG: cell division protein FtsZ [Alphaproteobacteria bacterium]